MASIETLKISLGSVFWVSTIVAMPLIAWFFSIFYRGKSNTKRINNLKLEFTAQEAKTEAMEKTIFKKLEDIHKDVAKIQGELLHIK